MKKSQDPIYEIYESYNDDHYDYSHVEDIAGVDYQKAIYFTAGYILLHIFGEKYLEESLWTMATTILVVAIWYYFRKYFDEVQDFDTAKWINGEIVGYVIFGITNLYIYMNSSVINIDRDPQLHFENLATVASYGTFLSLSIIIAASFKLLFVQKRHPFPLKGIAISTMLVIPIYMIFSLLKNTAVIQESFLVLQLLGSLIFGGSPEEGKLIQVGLFGNLFFMIPYFFLLNHFYRADADDIAP